MQGTICSQLCCDKGKVDEVCQDNEYEDNVEVPADIKWCADEIPQLWIICLRRKKSIDLPPII